MTKEDLVRNVTERSRIHLGRSLCQADVEAVFQALKDVAAQELTAGGEVPLPGLGKLKTEDRAARMGPPQREQRQARKSFLFGASYTIIERLEAQKEKTPVTPGALVPVKGNLIDAAMPEDVRYSEARPLHLRAGDCLAGICAGQSVPLSTPINV